MTGQIWKWKSPLWFIRHFKGQTVSIPKVGLHVFPFLTAHFLVWTTCTFWLDCTLKLYYGSCLRSLVDVRFRVRQLSCLQNDRQTDRQNGHITSALLAEVIITAWYTSSATGHTATPALFLAYQVFMLDAMNCHKNFLNNSFATTTVCVKAIILASCKPGRKPGRKQVESMSKASCELA